MYSAQQFLDMYEKHIKRDGAKELLDWIRQSDFLVAPGSTRFHDNFEGGLAHHSMSVCVNLKKLVKHYGLEDQYSDETIVIVALLHDLCKANFYKKEKRNVKENGEWIQKDVYTYDELEPFGDHGDKSVIIAMKFMKLTDDEIYAIRAHMGGYDNAVRGGSGYVGKIYNKCKLAVLLHFADMEATYLN